MLRIIISSICHDLKRIVNFCSLLDSFDAAKSAINTTVLTKNAEVYAESNAEKIAKYKVKEAKEIIESNIRFEKNKTAEKCSTEAAMKSRPCECPDGQILTNIEWTEKAVSTPTTSASGNV